MVPLLHTTAVVISLLILLLPAQAYIPAVPTNDTTLAIADGLNVSDISRIYFQWYNVVDPNLPGEDFQLISYLFVGENSNGVSKGALVHFSEDDVTGAANDATTTPWIALIACDSNSTHASQFWDIFTLAFQRGAVGALLYSAWSQACIVNSEYRDPNSYNRLMDIFSTQSLASARVILSQFSTVNSSIYGDYNATTLNASQATMNQYLAAGYPNTTGYLLSTLDAYNATGSLNITSATNAQGTPNGGGGAPSSKTTLAMIILYAITGCIAGLFAVVIITGVIRAVRHPERYRAGGGGGDASGPGRGGVLTRAILDTFPLIKFGAPRGDADTTQMGAKDHDLEGYGNRPSPMLETRDIQSDVPSTSSARPDTPRGTDANAENDAAARPHSHEPGLLADDADLADLPPARPRAGPSRSATTTMTNSAASAADPLPESIGRETCPICIVDFEEGDDVRVLPCEGKHVFHQACVDPWLLELSSSCPICRHDFQALETMLAGDEPTERRASQTPRFSRYLRFARRRHRHRMEEEDPSDRPVSSLAPVPGSVQEH
ncbi:hypothetical protein EI94DRAFT_1829676 [Lactarius quietus]|nr:hypothetical protein EI94DRAFT_1829676 [Lactarius quietus]